MKKISILLAIILLFSVFFSGCEKKGKKEVFQDEKAINVETMKVKKRNLEIETMLSGKIQPIEASNIVPKTPGKVMKVNVEIGDRVQKGEVLFELEKKDMLNAVKTAEASYNAAVASLENTKEQMEYAKRDYERIKKLYEEGAVSKKELEQYELQASEIKLEVAKTQLQQAKVTLENAKSNLADCVVTAPISGVITFVNINEGEMATVSQPSIGIANLDKVIIETTISEYLINKVHENDEVSVFIKSASSTPFKGRISALSPAPAKNEFTYPIKITLENQDKIIKAGMFAEIQIVSEKKENILSVPSDAVIIKDGYPTVVVVEGDRAKMKKVSLGSDNGQFVEITEGIKEGEEVVIKGQNYLDEGSKVKIIK